MAVVPACGMLGVFLLLQLFLKGQGTLLVAAQYCKASSPLCWGMFGGLPRGWLIAAVCSCAVSCDQSRV